MWFILNSTDCLLQNPAPAGYNVTGSTTMGATPTVTCANEYSGTPASVRCQADGTWNLPYSGCSRGTYFNEFEIICRSILMKKNISEYTQKIPQPRSTAIPRHRRKKR